MMFHYCFSELLTLAVCFLCVIPYPVQMFLHMSRLAIQLIFFGWQSLNFVL